MSEPTWEVFPETYNALYVYLVARPFVFLETRVTVEGAAGASKWDVKESLGSDGASIHYRGYTPAKPTVTFELRTIEHELEFDEMFGAIAPKPGKRAPTQIAVVHPMLAKVRLALFVVDDITIPKRVEAGIYETTLKLTQWFRQPVAVKKPTTTGNIAGVTVTTALRAPAAPAAPSASPTKLAP